MQTRSIGPAPLTAAAANVAHLQPSAPSSLSRRARPQPTTSVVTYRATANSRLIAGSLVGASIRHNNVEAVVNKDNFNLTATVCFRHRLATSRRGEEATQGFCHPFNQHPPSPPSTSMESPARDWHEGLAFPLAPFPHLHHHCCLTI